jgi:hypothetical protein
MTSVLSVMRCNEHLHGLADPPLSRGDEGEVHARMVDLDGDEQQARRDGAQAGRQPMMWVTG